MRFLLTGFYALCLLLTSCKEQESADPMPGVEGTYFSVAQFTKDQLDTHLGYPVLLSKKITLNGKEDSVIMDAFHADWGDIFNVFFKTDIGERKYLGQYEFSTFTDDATYSRVLYYAAKSDKLFTRTLQIRIDPETNRVLSLYIETGKNSFWRDVSQKLYYVPMKLIQIQELEEPLIGSSRNLHIEYRFM